MIDINSIFLISSILLTVGLVINFIYLVVKYQKDKMLPIVNISEKELLDKHGAIICSCILQKRNFKPRDIIAVLVSLIQKDEISIELKRTSIDGEITNEYCLKRTSKNTELSEMEQGVIDIFFSNTDRCVLNYDIKKISRKLDTASLIRKSNKALENLGVNAVKLPSKVKFRNNLFFILVCIFFILHIVYNFDKATFFEDIKINFKYWVIIVIKIDAIVILGAILTKLLTLVVERFINKKFQRKIELNDEVILEIFAKFLLTNCIILIFLMFAGNNSFFIADILLMDVAMVLMVCDEMFTGHSIRLRKEYISLKNFEERLETKEIIEYFHIDKLELLKQYIPFLVACNFKKVNMLEYVEKIISVSLDENEKEKYKSIFQLISFEDNSLNDFYFSKSFDGKK